MGLFDFFLTDEHKKEKIVIKIGLESGIFEECPICRDVTESRNVDAVQQRLDSAIQKYVSSNDDSYSLFGRDETRLREKFNDVAAKMPFDCTCHNI